jgi:hypothetical protein
MGNLVNALNKLKTNLFGTPYAGVPDAIPRNSAIDLAQKNPLSKMDYDPFGFSSLVYPRELADYSQNGHYIIFYINAQDTSKYPHSGYNDKGQVVSVGGVTTKIITKEQEEQSIARDSQNPTKYVTAGQEYYERGNSNKIDWEKTNALKGMGVSLSQDRVDLSKQPQKVSSGLANYWGTSTYRITDSIALYLPPNVQDKYTMKYNAHRTGMLGFMAATGKGLIEGFNERDHQKVADYLYGGIMGFGDYAVKKMALSLAEFAASAEGGEELFNRAWGRADNPYMEVLFDSPDLREFTYKFDFIPRNVKETEDVQRIIQMFRFHMAPEMRDDKGRFMTLPSEFDIHYMYQSQDNVATENDYYNKISTCVLKDCAVDYTPEKVASHADGSPVHITMSLTFAEIEMITKQKVQEGF